MEKQRDDLSVQHGKRAGTSARRVSCVAALSLSYGESCEIDETAQESCGMMSISRHEPEHTMAAIERRTWEPFP